MRLSSFTDKVSGYKWKMLKEWWALTYCICLNKRGKVIIYLANLSNNYVWVNMLACLHY